MDRFFSVARWLQSSVYTGKVHEAAGWLIWHYEDGTEAKVPMIYGKDTARFWADDAQLAAEHDFPVPVWTQRETKAEVGQDRTLRVYEQSWTNPFPQKKISTLDFVSNMESTAAPFLIAITVEP